MRSVHDSIRGSSNLLGQLVLLAAACNASGWILSTAGSLHAPGFALAIPFTYFVLIRITGLGYPGTGDVRQVLRSARRFAKPLPLGFMVIAVLATLGGLLHAPNNMDALHSRMPRVAHWLMEERWTWFPANNNAQNTRSCGFEWITAPMISLTGTDRFTFLINSVAFLILPGACFGVMRGLGLGGKISWTWMWLVPTGYCFALQAGGVGNDLAPALFAASAFAFGFRWKRQGGLASAALALASLAMMTACKPSTLPLLLPFAVLFLGMWRTALAHPLRSAALAAFLALASFLPTAVLNIRHCGDWTGLRAENPDLAKVEPIVGIAGNLINASLQNLAPPVFPLAGKWNPFFIRLFPEPFKEAMKRSFEPTGAEFILPDIQGEEWAGIGAGITYLLGITMLIAFAKERRGANKGASPRVLLYTALFGTALMVYFAKTGLYTVARHISPFYLFLIAVALLALRPEKTIRTRLWKLSVFMAMASTALMLVITPSRPLWPAKWFSGKFGESPANPVIARASIGYSIYADRADALGPLRRELPADANRVGFMSFAAGSEMPFWKPYGTMRVHHIRPGQSITKLRREGMRHVVINRTNFENRTGTTPEQWASDNGGRIVFSFPVRITVQGGLSDWLLIELPALNG